MPEKEPGALIKQTIIPKEDSETDDTNDMDEIDSRSILGNGSTTFLGFL